MEKYQDFNTQRRFLPLLSKLQARLVAWRFRGRTLHGRAIILRTIVLPLLWYPAAVTPLPPSGIDSVWKLCKAFLFQRPLDLSSASIGPMHSNWITLPTSKGGLGLPCIQSFSRAMHLCLLRDGFKGSATCQAPSWFLPALELMSHALQGTGVGLDILYSSIHRSSIPQSRWSCLGSLWYATFQQWYRLLRGPSNTTTHLSDQLQAPIWRHYRRVFGSAQRPLEYASIHAKLLYQQGYQHLSDFICRHGTLPTHNVFQEAFPRSAFPRLRDYTATVNLFKTHIEKISSNITPTYGPMLPQPIAAAFQPWSFMDTPFVKMSNQRLYRMLHRLPRIVVPPDKALEVQSPTQWNAMWKRERTFNQDVLPVFADLNFRLQHNGLRLRYKYRYHTSDILCSHGCDSPETARHLFWECSLASKLWSFSQFKIFSCIDGPLTWDTVVYGTNLVLSTPVSQRYGSHNILRVLNVYRCVILRTLWLTRNDAIFKHQVACPTQLYIMARCYLIAHIRRLKQISSSNNGLMAVSDYCLAPLLPMHFPALVSHHFALPVKASSNSTSPILDSPLLLPPTFVLPVWFNQRWSNLVRSALVYYFCHRRPDGCHNSPWT